MRVKLWGTRGSLPSPHTPQELEQRMVALLKLYAAKGKGKDPVEFLNSLPVSSRGGFGGNTSCVEVKLGGTSIVIDGGTGIRLLGEQLAKGPCGKGKGEVHLVFSHFHLDHIIGLPFFLPLYVPGNKIHIYAVQKEAKQVMKALFKKPFFPVPYSKLEAKFQFHVLKPRKPNKIGALTVTPYKLDHPDPCWGFKIAGENRVYSHCVDTECSRAGRKQLAADLPLYQGVDVMLFDAQYTLSEAVQKLYWGHSAATFGLDIAMREGIRRMIFTHSDPAHSDKDISDAENQTRTYYNKTQQSAKGSGLHEVRFEFAREGMEFDV